jgi:hypothetical protein
MGQLFLESPEAVVIAQVNTAKRFSDLVAISLIELVGGRG